MMNTTTATLIGIRNMKRSTGLISLSAILVLVLSACATAPSAPVVKAPENLKAPSDQIFVFDYAATGVQIYSCKSNKTDASKFEWSFIAPEAELFDHLGVKVGKHYAGPTWESNDGSKVVGEVVSRQDSTEPNAIPWLLLKSKTNSGEGAFAQIKSIQRLATIEGKAPTTGCDASTLGKEVRAPYKAYYNFFKAQ
jgi:hypothetical protein